MTPAANTSERVSRVIFEYAAKIGQEQDTQNLLHLNADMARDLVGADRCSIWLVDAASSQLHTTVAHGVGEIRIGIGDGLVGACVAQAAPIVVNDTSADERFLNRIDQGSGYETHSVLVVPLCGAGGSVIGAFQALNKPGGFSESDVALLGFAGSYSAAAIETQRLRSEAEQARIVLHDLEVARDVQAGLLPERAPDIAGLDCAAYFRPAKIVGGDYYDFVETPDGRLAFTLGDVSGKGIPAAVFMASIQASLRIPLSRGPESLTGLVAELNNSVHASAADGRYSTLFCGIIDPRSRRLNYVNAGQSAPMLVREGRIEHLSSGGFPVGMLPMASYEEGATDMSPGDVLVCFSDGISEACNPQEELWRESDIEGVLRSAPISTAQEVTERVVREADAFAAGADQADDMTVVTIRLKRP
jgi:sigma-B regulation protein RsbU (phosphoserine phosphatase)